MENANINRDEVPKSKSVSAVVMQFMKLLRECEQTGNTQSLAKIFKENAECVNLTRHNTPSGREHGRACSATKFWSQYVHAFDHVDSYFTHVIDDGRTAVLEWESIGRLPMGLPFEYSGVSILEYDDAGICAFRTYYDSAVFLPHAPRTAKTQSEAVGKPVIDSQVSS